MGWGFTCENLAREVARLCFGFRTSGTASLSATAALCSCAKAAVYLKSICRASAIYLSLPVHNHMMRSCQWRKIMPWEMHAKAEQLYLHVHWSPTELTAALSILCAAEDLLEMLAKAAATVGGGPLTPSSAQLCPPGMPGGPLSCSPQCHCLSRAYALALLARAATMSGEMVSHPWLSSAMSSRASAGASWAPSCSDRCSSALSVACSSWPHTAAPCAVCSPGSSHKICTWVTLLRINFSAVTRPYPLWQWGYLVRVNGFVGLNMSHAHAHVHVHVTSVTRMLRQLCHTPHHDFNHDAEGRSVSALHQIAELLQEELDKSLCCAISQSPSALALNNTI